MRNACKIMVRISEGKRPVRRPTHGWDVNIRMDLREIEWEGMDLYIWLRIETSGGLL
jgi:hypothetical protein